MCGCPEFRAPQYSAVRQRETPLAQTLRCFRYRLGRSAANADAAIEAIATRLILLSPEEGVVVLKAAGFDGVELFHAGLTFNGWVGYRAP